MESPPHKRRWAQHQVYGCYVYGRGAIRERNVRVARTLTGHGTCLHSGPEAKPLLDAALARLRDFAFVGIVERWAESICLFHMQFGGKCLDVEFEHLRSQPHVHKVPYPSAPNVDDTIYAEGKLLFSQALKKHNVTPENCARISCRL